VIIKARILADWMKPCCWPTNGERSENL